jgi:hypothetical protein
MPPDVDALASLRRQLEQTPGIQWLPARTFQAWQDYLVRSLVHEEPNAPAGWRKDFAEELAEDDQLEAVLRLIDADIVDRLRVALQEAIGSALEIIESNATHDVKTEQLHGWEQRVTQQQTTGDVIALVQPTGLVTSYYSQMIRNVAHHNAIMAAAEIYSIRAETGRLPAELPTGVPSNPCTGRPFEYEIGTDGFVL